MFFDTTTCCYKLEASRYIENIVDISPISDCIGFKWNICNFSIFYRTFPDVNLKTKNYTSKTEHPIWQCDTSLRLVTSLLVRNGSWGITLTLLTTLPTTMKYMSIPEHAAVKDIDITNILGQKYPYRIDIGKGDIDPPLLKMSNCFREIRRVKQKNGPRHISIW